VERFLGVLAAWNHGFFQIRIAGARSERLEDPGPAAVEQTRTGAVAVKASDTLFIEDHVETDVRKANGHRHGETRGRGLPSSLADHRKGIPFR
jgi:uncharacterized protein (AIM24 family)